MFKAIFVHILWVNACVCVCVCVCVAEHFACPNCVVGAVWGCINLIVRVSGELCVLSLTSHNYDIVWWLSQTA